MILHGGTQKSPLSRGFNRILNASANALACSSPSVPPHPGPIALVVGQSSRPDARAERDPRFENKLRMRGLARNGASSDPRRYDESSMYCGLVTGVRPLSEPAMALVPLRDLARRTTAGARLWGGSRCIATGNSSRPLSHPAGLGVRCRLSRGSALADAAAAERRDAATSPLIPRVLAGFPETASHSIIDRRLSVFRGPPRPLVHCPNASAGAAIRWPGRLNPDCEAADILGVGRLPSMRRSQQPHFCQSCGRLMEPPHRRLRCHHCRPYATSIGTLGGYVAATARAPSRLN